MNTDLGVVTFYLEQISKQKIGFYKDLLNIKHKKIMITRLKKSAIHYYTVKKKM